MVTLLTSDGIILFKQFGQFWTLVYEVLSILSTAMNNIVGNAYTYLQLFQGVNNLLTVTGTSITGVNL